MGSPKGSVLSLTRCRTEGAVKQLLSPAPHTRPEMLKSEMCPDPLATGELASNKANGREQDPKLSGYYDYKEAKIKTCVRKGRLQGTTPRGGWECWERRLKMSWGFFFCLCFSDLRIPGYVVVPFIMKTINLFFLKKRERKWLVAKGVGVTHGRSGGREKQGGQRGSGMAGA